MIPYLEDKADTYDRLIAFRNKNRTLISTIPELAVSFDEFEGYVGIIKSSNLQSVEAKAGKYEVKLDAKHVLVSTIVPAVRSLRTYARRNKLQEVINLTQKTTRSKLLRLNKVEFDEKINSYYKLLDANKANLSGFNVTPEKVAQIKTSIDSYYAAEKDHLASGGAKTAAHLSMEEAFDMADDVLKEDIDGMMEHFREDNSDVYNEYQSARVIHAISGSKSAPKTESAKTEEAKQQQ